MKCEVCGKTIKKVEDIGYVFVQRQGTIRYSTCGQKECQLELESMNNTVKEYNGIKEVQNNGKEKIRKEKQQKETDTLSQEKLSHQKLSHQKLSQQQDTNELESHKE
jgi:hypothetical protein